MSSDANLPDHNLNRQQSLTKKKGNLSWIGFFIDLIILHILFCWELATFGWHFPLEFALEMTTFFLALAVADYIASMSYIKKRYPPWKVIFIPLFLINAIFFGFLIVGPVFAPAYFDGNWGLGAIVVYVNMFIFLVIDLIQLLVYVFTRHT
jgi:hypothetical protein